MYSKLATCCEKRQYVPTLIATDVDWPFCPTKQILYVKQFGSYQQLTPNDTSIYSIQFTHIPGSVFTSSFSTNKETLHLVPL